MIRASELRWLLNQQKLHVTLSNKSNEKWKGVFKTPESLVQSIKVKSQCCSGFHTASRQQISHYPLSPIPSHKTVLNDKNAHNFCSNTFQVSIFSWKLFSRASRSRAISNENEVKGHTQFSNASSSFLKLSKECSTSYTEARKEEEESACVHSNRRMGSIHLIMGPMFAGKTTELLKRVMWERLEGRIVELVKSSVDTRYAESSVVSHDGLQLTCLAVPDMETFQDAIGWERFQMVDVIAIDESQFIKGLSEWCQIAADEHNKTIIVAGLDGDFRRHKFGDLVDMVPTADSVTKMSARCRVENCNQRAHFTFRKSMDTNTEVVGGAELYVPVCRAHYRDRVRTMEALAAIAKQFHIMGVAQENNV